MSKNYFVNHPVSERIIHIEDPLEVFATLLLGEDKALLLDTSFGIGNLKEHVRTITDLPLIVVNSHGHVDHLCGNYHFDEIYIHEKDMELARLHTSKAMREGNISSAREKGVLPEDLDLEAYIDEGPGNLIPLEEGHVFDVGGLNARVIHIPGHTQGSIGLLVEEEGIFILGDAANPFVFLFLPESSSVEDYLKTLHKIKSFDFERIIISHHPVALPKGDIDYYIECALNIDVDKSEPFVFPPFDDNKPLLYAHGDWKRNDPRYAGIVYTRDRL